MAKDPAVLVYFDKWISSTNGMKAHLRAWYMDLLFYQYDNPDGIPDDTDVIAGICRILPSEYQMLEQMLEQVLKLKFKLCEGKWKNNFAEEIISKRQDFKSKRAKSGNIGVIIKLAKTIKGFNNKYLARLKDSLYQMNDEEIEQAKNKQMLEQMLKLYINEDVDVNINKDKSINKDIPSKEDFSNYALEYIEENKIGKKEQYQSQIESKYDTWVASGWKDGYGKKIENWKLKIQNTIPHIKPIYGKSNNNNQQNGFGNQNGNTARGNPTSGKVSASSILARQAREQSTGNSESGDVTIEAEVVE
ncbi:Uncharacterized protein conserved in bacteria [Chryseobacterium gleum]|uniref:Uncharacterized protein conserved in bacteria n=2 Tax=Chryseobacterium gleum TaxID=250 RepID=A0A3S4MFH3_CHRGE|nr:DUF1376 domain-containing protein [Chryseobacterium gleum]EFK36843.1 hypothetical protein HMPREF0204_11400 [Chryseobacterium gleum ATCC 35910]QQY32093.1 DUF1376 domain-containing protein [Chryseobacterium gleum]VEE10683.1 Uncharacterized protein conserved in bacteria [Chryseobacterium gleum]